MDNQHQRIKGYRDLTQVEIDLMNKIKAHGQATASLIAEVRGHLETQTKDAQAVPPPEGMTELLRQADAEPMRWLAMARTELQTGLMKLVRSVAQPTTF